MTEEDFFYCDICGGEFERTELYYSEGDCPIRDCPGIDENIHPLSERPDVKE